MSSCLGFYQQGLINNLESVQTFALLKASTRNRKAGYDTLIETCNLPTLEQRQHFLKLSILCQSIQLNGHTLFPSALIPRSPLQRNLRNSLCTQMPISTHFSHRQLPHGTVLLQMCESINRTAQLSSEVWCTLPVRIQCMHFCRQSDDSLMH